MPKVSEQISKANATSQGRTDANLANDSNNLGGLPANDYATKKYVQDYHNGKEENLKQYINSQDASVLEQAKEYTNSQIRNQDFSNFAEIGDLQALNTNLSSQITEGLNSQKQYTDQKTQAIVNDVNANFQDVENSISSLNGTVNNLFTSVSNGKSVIAGAITDKGVPTSASDSFSTMAGNIRAIPTTGGGGSGTDPNYVNTSDATATASDILNGKTAYVKGQKIYGNLIYTGGTDYEPNPDNPYPQKAEVELVYGEKEGEIESFSIGKIPSPRNNSSSTSDYYLFDISSDKRLMVVYNITERKIKTYLRQGDNTYKQEINQDGEYRTPEYTLEQLGIDDTDYEIRGLKFSIMNADQNVSGYECRLAILLFKKTNVGKDFKAYIYRISTFNGEIKLENEEFEAGNEREYKYFH